MTDADMDALAERIRRDWTAEIERGKFKTRSFPQEPLIAVRASDAQSLLTDFDRLKAERDAAIKLAYPNDIFDPTKRGKESYKLLWESACEMAAEASVEAHKETDARDRLKAENATLRADRQKVEAASLELIETTQRLTEASETMRGKLLPLQLEADALRARVAELAELLTSASSAMPEWFAHLHERIDAALGATKGEGHDEA